jgi:twitching motility protein PilT
LIKRYLISEGGYAFTIEDPIEMPLDGVYQTKNGDLGLCKQTMPPNGKWADGIKSALRSKPRYIYVGEIRSPEAAVELLRAATSGHLVFSTIHGNNVTDAINALAKYASSYGISEDMAYEMIANGFLCCVHQTLSGTPRRLQVESIFSNPNLGGGCAVRAMIRTGRLNFGSIIEQQQSKMNLGRPLFDE